MKIKVCEGKKCKKNGGDELYDKLLELSKEVNEHIEKEGIDKKKLKIEKTSCQSNCKHAPSVKMKSGKMTGDFEEIKKTVLKKYKMD